MKKDLSWISKSSKNKRTGYHDDTPDFSALPQDKVQAVCAFCHYDGKFVIVKNEGRWEPVAGHVEKGESPEQALVREIKEESNMRVLKYFPVGYLYISEVDIYQTRYLCLVEPYGPFLEDPDGGVTEIKLVSMEELLEKVDRNDSALLMVDRCLEIITNLGI